jgi:hypothetical protein
MTAGAQRQEHEIAFNGSPSWLGHALDAQTKSAAVLGRVSWGYP